MRRLWHWIRDTTWPDEPLGSRTSDGVARDVAWALILERRAP